MPGYLRTKTRPQGDRPIRRKQDNYGGGLNVDDPATDIDNNEVAGSENFIWHERFGRGRSGSVEVADIPEVPAGADYVNAHFYHQEIKSLLYHQEGKLYRWNGPTATEITSFTGASFIIDETTEIKAYGKNALIFTSTGIFFILVEESGYATFFPFNSGQPKDIAVSDTQTTTEVFKYKYAYTLCTIINIVTGNLSTGSIDRLSATEKLIHESPPVLTNETPEDLSYFRLRSINFAVSETNTQAIEVGALDDPTGSGSVPDHINYFGLYRTLDLGVNGLNNINVDQFGWVGDGEATTGEVISDVSDATLTGRLLTPIFTLRTIGWIGLPDSNVGEVTETFIFAATRNDKTLFYSQRVDDTIAGFYNAGFQEEEFDDGIQVLAGTPDILSVICNRRSYIGSLTSFINVGVAEAVISLTHFTLIDSEIGVRDFGSFAAVSRGTYISVCSDDSVRIWDGGGWSRDLTQDKINKIIRTLNETITTGRFYNGSYYIWIDTTNSGTPTQCFVYSLQKQSGRGWTEFTGAEWIFPQAQRGVFIADNFLTSGGQGMDFLFAIDAVDQKIFWIETFDGKDTVQINGNDIRSFFADKISIASPNGTNIKCRVKVKERTGAMEAWNLKHEESHAYMRDLVDATTNLLPPPILYPELKSDARAYVNGVLVSVNTAGEVPPGDDIHFDYRVEGSRIAIEFESNRSGFELVGTDTRFRVQDILRPSRGQEVSVSTSFQNDFQQDLVAWLFTRPSERSTLDRATGTQFTRNGATFVTAPDLRSQGVGVTVTGINVSIYTIKNTKVFDSFTFNSWIKTPNLSTLPGSELVLVRFNGGGGNPTVEFILNNLNILSTPQGAGTVALDDPTTGTGNVNGWSQIILVREDSSSTVNVYQNDSLKGTLTLAGLFGGGIIEIGGVV